MSERCVKVLSRIITIVAWSEGAGQSDLSVRTNWTALLLPPHISSHSYTLTPNNDNSDERMDECSDNVAE